MSGLAGRHMASWMAWAGFVGLRTATPLATAARTTASASIAENAREIPNHGQQRRAWLRRVGLFGDGSSGGPQHVGVTLKAPETIAPRPRPGSTGDPPPAGS